VTQVLSEILSSKIAEIMRLFNLQPASPKSSQEDLQTLLRPFLKNHYKEIFRDQSINQAITTLLDTFITTSGYFTTDEIDTI
jgi:hypothetical protein